MKSTSNPSQRMSEPFHIGVNSSHFLSELTQRINTDCDFSKMDTIKKREKKKRFLLLQVVVFLKKTLGKIVERNTTEAATIVN